MRLYLRILSYLRAHAWLVLGMVGATFLFAGFNAFSFVLLIPFLEKLFGVREPEGAVPGEAPGPEGAVGPEAAPGVEGGPAVQVSPGTAENQVERILESTVGRFVDLQGDPQEAIQGVIIFMLVVFALKNVFDFLKTYLTAMLQQRVSRDMRNEVYDHLLELDLAFFGRTRTGQIISRLTHDVEQLRLLVTREVSRLISSFFEFLAALYFMLAISVPLTLAAFIVVPGTMVIWGPLLKRLRRGDRRVLDLAGEVNSHIQETVSGVRLVKTAAAEGHEQERFHGLTDDYYHTYVRTERLRSLAQPITEMLAAIGTVILLWYGAHLVLVEGEITGAAFMSFLALSMGLYSPVKFMSKFPAIVQPGLVGAERVFEFLDAPIEITEGRGARPFPGLEREIVYDDVTFAYRDGSPVLRDVSFRVPKGSVVALVGPSGAGKTTLVDLLGRFYDPTEGRILVDGTDLREFTISSLRNSLGVVSQETILFHDTVRSNIAYGIEERVSDEEVEAAARAAHAHEFVRELPEGYRTVVGERGAELSGGQRQRIAIARAILRDPPILIFDEATSALDTESERLVQDAVERLLEGRTVFVIAHRLSTVQRADRILVLDHGRIVERGTHAELLATGGLYHRLHEMQFSDGASAGVPAEAPAEE